MTYSQFDPATQNRVPWNSANQCARSGRKSLPDWIIALTFMTLLILSPSGRLGIGRATPAGALACSDWISAWPDDASSISIAVARCSRASSIVLAFRSGNLSRARNASST